MSTIKSSAEDLTLNADGAGNDIKFQSNGVEKASLTDAGVFTATSLANAPSLGTNSIIRTNALTISENITFAGTENGITAGPVTINNGYTVTVTSPSVWHVI